MILRSTRSTSKYSVKLSVILHHIESSIMHSKKTVELMYQSTKVKSMYVCQIYCIYICICMYVQLLYMQSVGLRVTESGKLLPYKDLKCTCRRHKSKPQTTSTWQHRTRCSVKAMQCNYYYYTLVQQQQEVRQNMLGSKYKVGIKYSATLLSYRSSSSSTGCKTAVCMISYILLYCCCT